MVSPIKIRVTTETQISKSPVKPLTVTRGSVGSRDLSHLIEKLDVPRRDSSDSNVEATPSKDVEMTERRKSTRKKKLIADVLSDEFDSDTEKTPNKSRFVPTKTKSDNGVKLSAIESLKRNGKNRRSTNIVLSDSEEDLELTSQVKSMSIQSPRLLRDRSLLKPMDRLCLAASPRRSSRRLNLGSPATPLSTRVLEANTPRSSLRLMDSPKASPDLSKSVRKRLDMVESPMSAKKVGVGHLTPVVPERQVAPEAPSSSRDIALFQLQASALPQCLPCREKEFENIKGFVARKIDSGTGGCMYISGVPGTGKTATVNNVIKTLQQLVLDDKLPPFKYVEVNGFTLTEPRHAYVRIWQSLTNQKVTPDQAFKLLEDKFSGKPKNSTVLLVDELDCLCNRKQDVIYNILDWTTKMNSKLVVLSIANTMDLPERTLKGKVTSRMGLTRLVFQPYSHRELEEILLNRLNGCNALHPDAVQLVAKKVASISGDARRALDICTLSIQQLNPSDQGTISAVDMREQLNVIFGGTRVQYIKNCSVVAKLVLRAIRDEVVRKGVEETTVRAINPHLISICALEGRKPPSVGDIHHVCNLLADYGLIVAEDPRKDLSRKLALNVSHDEVSYGTEG